jgi:PLP dependent protein
MVDTAHAVTGLRKRFEYVRKQIEVCAQRCNRSAEEITLVAVTKTHPVDIVREAIQQGLTDFGENRVQEGESKILELGRNAARWHLIGHLQDNKARRAVKLFDTIHSLDSVSLAERLDRLCTEEGRDELPVFIQVDLAREATKSGIAEDKLLDLVKATKECRRLRLLGLMTLPPFLANAESVRPFFRRLRNLRDELQAENYFGALLGQLSMGMSHDFEVAVEEGTTMVRIGTAIFGPRA